MMTRTTSEQLCVCHAYCKRHANTQGQTSGYLSIYLSIYLSRCACLSCRVPRQCPGHASQHVCVCHHVCVVGRARSSAPGWLLREGCAGVASVELCAAVLCCALDGSEPRFKAAMESTRHCIAFVCQHHPGIVAEAALSLDFGGVCTGALGSAGTPVAGGISRS